MKKSNQIIFAAIGAVFIFSIAFQLKVNRYLRNYTPEKENVTVVSEKRAVANFTKISVSDGIEVYFSQDSTNQLKVDAPKNVLTHIKTEVKGEELLIQKNNKSKTQGTIKVFISSNQLHGVKAVSGAYFETVGEVSGEKLFLEFSSDTKANLELSYQSIICKAASGSQVKFRGNTANIEFTN